MAEDNFKSGFVAIIGRPNVGKSTTLNSLVGDKISIVSPIPQTTRYQIRGILNLENAQAVFVDTPGVHSFNDKLAKHLNVIAKSSLEGCDIIVYVVDVSRQPGDEEDDVMNFLLSQKMKIIIALNKMDLARVFVDDYVALWKEKISAKKIDDPVISYLPLSAKTGKNIDTLRKLIIENLPPQPPFYDNKNVTDFPLKYRIADEVREKLFLQLKNELPHSLAVEVEEIKEKAKITYIRVLIYVNRPSQKKIVVGKQGAILKEVGQAARIDIEKILGRKVFLDIWVKIVEDWQNKPRILQELGYWWA